MDYLDDLFLEESLSKQSLDNIYIDKNKRDRLINEAIEFLNEAYIGKTDTLLEIEDQINIIRGRLNRFGEFNRLKEVQKVNRLFEKQFGMNIFALHMEPDNVYNAYTKVVANNFDVYKRKNFSSYLVADRKDGYKFKSDNDFCICAYMYYGLLADPDVTDGEIVAILLHEIGHNFADFLDDNIRIYNQAVMDSYVISTIMKILISVLCLDFTTAGANFADLVRSGIDMNNRRKSKIEKNNQNRSNRVIGPTIKGAASSVKGFLTVCGVILLKTNPIFMAIAKMSKSFNEKIFGDYNRKATLNSSDRRNEVIADKFAAVYGYGPELGTALQKMGSKPMKDEQIIAKIPFLGESINKYWEKLSLNFNEFDCHPHDIQRINECIKTLEDELKQKDMDPKLKSVIMSQIKEMKSNVNATRDLINKDPNNIKYAYDAYVADELPDAVTKGIEDEINEELNKALRESSYMFDNNDEILTEGSLNKVTLKLRVKNYQDLNDTLKKHEYSGLLNFALKQKNIDNLRYLRADAYVAIKQVEKVKKAIQEKDMNNEFVKDGNIKIKDCDLTIRWFKNKYIPAVSERIKELSE